MHGGNLIAKKALARDNYYGWNIVYIKRINNNESSNIYSNTYL